ncbi:MAG: hypothetical protein ACJ735_12480 [Actinomycetes bacterium]
MATYESMNPTPALGDYLGAAWRHRVIVLVSVALGGLLGALVVPLVTTNTRTYAASQRVDIKAFGSEKAASAGTSTTRSGNSGNGVARYADPTVMAAALKSLGARAGHLDQTNKANSGVSGLSKLSAKPVTGTTWVDLTFTDHDAGLTGRVIRAYVATYVASRNKAATAAQASLVATLTAQSNSDFKEVAAWSRQADAERQASAGHVTSALTAAQLQVATKAYESTVSALSSARAQQSLKGLPTSVAGPVIVRTVQHPTSRRVLLVAGLVLGLLVGVGTACVVEALRRRLASSAEAEALTGLPLLGVIPTMASVRGGRIAVNAKPHSPAAEAIQRTRSALQLAGLGTSVKVLAILSPEDGGGKTTFVLNLAQSLANQGRTVVVVSANLRDRTLDRVHRTLARPGLAELVDGTAHDARELLVEVGPNSYLLPSGGSDRNPAESFMRATLTGIFAQLAEVGIVIVDSPPMMSSGEVIPLVSAADSSVVVARVGHATRAGLHASVLDLRRLNLPCMGLVGLGEKGWAPLGPRVSIDLDAGVPRPRAVEQEEEQPTGRSAAAKLRRLPPATSSTRRVRAE